MGIVKGFTDILAPQNLATNGSFRINQRGLFTSGLADAKVGDYVSDCWYVHSSTNVDFLQAYNNIPRGELSFSGYGKKGQLIRIYNRSVHLLNLPVSTPMTASIIGTYASASSVPLKFAFAPNDSGTTIHSKWPTISSKNPADTSCWIKHTVPAGHGGYPEIDLLLMADGFFHITFSKASVVMGEYVNPPTNNVIPFADDLLRCKRYYQWGRFTQSQSIVLPVEMAGTPTVTVSKPGLSLYPTSISADDVLGGSALVSSAGQHNFMLTRGENIPIVDLSGTITKYDGYGSEIITVRFGTPINCIVKTYLRNYITTGQTGTEEAYTLLATATRGTPGTRNVSLPAVAPSSTIVITYSNGVAGDAINIVTSPIAYTSYENALHWEAVV